MLNGTWRLEGLPVRITTREPNLSWRYARCARRMGDNPIWLETLGLGVEDPWNEVPPLTGAPYSSCFKASLYRFNPFRVLKFDCEVQKDSGSFYEGIQQVQALVPCLEKDPIPQTFHECKLQLRALQELRMGGIKRVRG